MDRPLKLWEFLSGLFAMMIAMGAIIYNCGMINGKAEVRFSTLEAQTASTDKKVEDVKMSVDNKMDKISNNIFDIKLMLQEKQDRKK